MSISFSKLAHPSKYRIFEYDLYNVGPTSKTLGRRCINVIQMFCVCWDVFIQNQSQRQIDFDFASFKIYRRMLFSPLDVVGRGSETQLQVCKKLTGIMLTFNTV